jgi:single-stranded-DNA-specific exonuclease
MQNIWREPPSIDVNDDLQRAIAGHPLVAQSLVRRGIHTPQAAERFLQPAHYSPADPGDLPDMDRAVTLVKAAIKQGRTLLVWGDFDVDGQTSTALLTSALRDLGATVRYHVPNRFTQGHGVHLPTLKQKLAGVHLLLTCDTGIAAHEAIAYAKAQGVTVVVTDHHSLPDVLPNADALVNPMRLAAGHPLRELPGVGVAYQLIRALYGTRSTEHLLDLVALGIVADVMVQVDDTRYWLQRGLDVLRANQRPGLQELLRRADINPNALSETDIGFGIGPRLNALGRLQDATPAIELLTTDDTARINVLVNTIEGLNAQRRFLSDQVYRGALAQLENDPTLLNYAALVLAQADWHTGVVGIVASRLVERYGRPVVLLSSNEAGLARGSARSVAGCDITAAFRQVSHLLTGYGGHNMAAGLSLSADNVLPLQRELSQVVRRMLKQADVPATPELQIDGYLSLSELTLDLAADLGRLAPFGNGNPPLTLATRDLHIRSRHALGQRAEHLKLTVEDDAGEAQTVFYWRGAQAEADDGLPQGRFDLAYTLRANTFRGKTEVMVEWLDARPQTDADQPIKLQTQQGAAWEDYRRLARPAAAAKLRDVLARYPQARLLAEVATPDADETIKQRTLARCDLQAAPTLIIWTPPPGPLLWGRLLDECRPERVLTFGTNPAVDTLDAFVQRFAGLLKFAARRGDALRLCRLAGAMAHTEATIRVGLAWFAARGYYTVQALDTGLIRVGAGDNQPVSASDVAEQQARLQRHLNEAAAYRRYWLTLPRLHGLQAPTNGV